MTLQLSQQQIETLSTTGTLVIVQKVEPQPPVGIDLETDPAKKGWHLMPPYIRGDTIEAVCGSYMAGPPEYVHTAQVVRLTVTSVEAKQFRDLDENDMRAAGMERAGDIPGSVGDWLWLITVQAVVIHERGSE